jgi:hypothetical protein
VLVGSRWIGTRKLVIGCVPGQSGESNSDAARAARHATATRTGRDAPTAPRCPPADLASGGLNYSVCWGDACCVVICRLVTGSTHLQRQGRQGPQWVKLRRVARRIE